MKNSPVNLFSTLYQNIIEGKIEEHNPFLSIKTGPKEKRDLFQFHV